MAVRAVLFASLLLSAAAGAAPTLGELAAMAPRERDGALASIRNSKDGESVLLGLETEASLRAIERRDAGEPPRFPGCLRSDEFELSSHLAMARASLDAKAFRAILIEHRRLRLALDTALTRAQASGDWRRQFAHLGHWIEDWSTARDPGLRELLRRTLLDQALRASLSSFEGAKLYGKTRPTVALRAYDEYVFNRMCNADEENLDWLKARLATEGWFDIGKYGRIADEAAFLMVQHADGDPAYQAHVVDLLAPKLATGDTDPQNHAHLVDAVAVRAGRPQIYGTQMECVNGQWLAPNVEYPDDLAARRAARGLPTYQEQLARGRHLCQKPRD
jgi:hypothetical protein